MKKLLLATIALTALFATSCKKKKDNNPTPTPSTDTVVILSGDISADKTLDATKKYKLMGFVYVKSGATIHIPAGTLIMGDKASKGSLVICRGGKIDAVGTAEKPIVFTSALAVGARSQGDWGGVILLGKAPMNATGGEARIEGGLVPTAGGDEHTYIWFGGTDANDNSGTMKYCRIEFAGIPFSPDNEINGLTMGGVGAGTTLSYIEVYRSGDDSYEWFGGTVNCDHLVAINSWDDDWDTDNGFSGHIQFCLSQRYKTIADQSGSNGFECDNDANGSTNLPQTKAMFSNMTVIGPIADATFTSYNANFQNGAQIRRNSSESIFNSILVGWPVGDYIDDTKGTYTLKSVEAGTLLFKGNILAGCKSNWKGLQATTYTAADTAAWNAYKADPTNTILTNSTDVSMVNPNQFSSGVAAALIGVPNFLLNASSPAMTGAVTVTSYYSGFVQTSYRGAFDGTNDWTKGWTNWSPETTVY